MDIGDVECMVLFYLFGRSLFLWLFMVCDRLCGCVPCLRYPRKGNTPRVYYCYYIIIIFSLLYFFFFKDCGGTQTLKGPHHGPSTNNNIIFPR